MEIQTSWQNEELTYTGAELRPHFLLSHFGIRGSALVGFQGEAKVSTEHLVDWEDRLENETIQAKKMVHFIGEFFGWNLKEGVLLQRLLVAGIGESLNQMPGKFPVSRRGDDLFAAERKLSVSIVTASPVSILLHLGINIDPTGAPVPAVGLEELEIDPIVWAQGFLEGFQRELREVDWACAKVRPVF